MKNASTSCVKCAARRRKVDLVTESMQHRRLTSCLKASSSITHSGIDPLSLAAWRLVLFKAARRFLSVYLQRHLPELFPRPCLNISRCVFTGGFSGGAEEEEGSLPPSAVRGLTGTPHPPTKLSRALTANVCSIPASAQSRITLESPDANPEALRWTCSPFSGEEERSSISKRSPGRSSPDPPPAHSTVGH